MKNNDKLYNLSSSKKSQFYITTILDFIWTQGYGDSDCEITYVGIIENILISDLIKPSQDRISEFEKDEKNRTEQFFNDLQEDPEFLF